MTSVVFNGNAYSDDGSQSRDMRNGGYRNWMLPMLSDAAVEINIAKDAQTYAAQAADYAAALHGTSTTSVTVAAGAHTITTQPSKQFIAGQYVMVSRQSVPGIRMWGPVTSYNNTTGELVFDAITAAGSGSYNDWQIGLSGEQGEAGPAARAYVSYKTTTYTVTLADIGNTIDCTGSWTLDLTAAATLGDGFYVWVRNTGTGTITIDPAGAETIDGVATYTLNARHYCLLICDGSAWKTTIAGLTGLRKLPILSDTSDKAALSNMELIDSQVSTGIGNTVGPIIWTGSLFIAASSNSAASCATSPTGQTWTLRSLPVSMAAACMAAIGSTVVLIQSGTTAAARSTDGGVTWSSMTLPAATNSPSIGVVGGLFMLAHTAASGSAYYTSPDGSAWTLHTNNLPIGNWAVSAETCGGLLFATDAAYPTTTYATTPDGTTWTARTLPAAPVVGRFHANGKRQVDGSYVYMSTAGLQATTDGINWSVLSTTSPSATYSPIKFRGAWLLREANATMYTAGNVAGAWTQRSTASLTIMLEGRYAVDHTAGNLVWYTNASNGKVSTINTSTPVVYGLFGD